MMMLDETKKIARAFNQAAPTYDQHARIQQEVAEQLIHLLSGIRPDFNNILDAGCGTGRTTNLLATHVRYKLINAIDIAEKLLFCNTEEFPARTNRYALDFNMLSVLPTHYDLIFSNMALQWSTSLAATLSLFYDQLLNHGLLCFSLPIAGTFTEIAEKFALHALPSHNEIENLLLDNKFEIISSHQQSHVDFFDGTLSALRSIKLVGANHTNAKKNIGLRGKGFLTNKPIHQLTYRVGYFIAKKST